MLRATRGTREKGDAEAVGVRLPKRRVVALRGAHVFKEKGTIGRGKYLCPQVHSRERIEQPF